MAEWKDLFGECSFRIADRLMLAVWESSVVSNRWYGSFTPLIPNAMDLTATTAEAAKAEIIERARVILTEALAALPGGNE